MRLVIVGAHAMDAELAAGCLAAAAVDAGWSVILLHLTLGERGHPRKDPQAFRTQLGEEAAEAAAALGCAMEWSGLPAPLDVEAAVPWLTRRLVELEPNLVVGHWSGSWHPSHRAAHRSTRRALDAAGVAGGKAVLAFGENCEDLDGFRATHVVPAAGVRDRYLRAAACYELFRLSMPEARLEPPIPYWAFYTAALRVRGLQAGHEQGQAFMSLARSLPVGLGFVGTTESRGRSGRTSPDRDSAYRPWISGARRTVGGPGSPGGRPSQPKRAG